MTKSLRHYLDDELFQETPAQRALRLQTCKLGAEAVLQADPSQAALIAWLINLGAVRVLEIGTFTGYGTLSMAHAVGPEGKVITLEQDEQLPKIGQPFWKQDGMENRIELRTGNILTSLAVLKAAGVKFDVVFIDADSPEYPAYFAAVRELTDAGAVIVVDNTLWHGRVAHHILHGEFLDTLRTFNRQLFGAKGEQPSSEFSAVMIPCWGGVTLLRVR